MPKIVDHDQYREELLNGCFELFSEKGYSNVTMRQIAKELKVSTGALYHYFPTKHAILEQMFNFMSKRDVEEAVAATSVSGSFEERMKIFLNFFIAKEAIFGKMLLLSIDFVRNNDTAKARQTAGQWLEYYIRNMSIYLEIPTDLARFMATFFNGVVYQSQLIPETVSVREQVNFFKTILMSFVGDHQDPKNRLCNMCPFMIDHNITEEVPH